MVIQSEVCKNFAVLFQILVSAKAVGSETVVHCNGYNSFFGKAFALYMTLVGASAREASAVNEYQNRTAFGILRSPDIQKIAVLAVCKMKPFSKFNMIKRIDLCIVIKGSVLITARLVLGCVINAVPFFMFYRHFISFGSCVTHASKLETSFAVYSFDFAAGR